MEGANKEIEEFDAAFNLVQNEPEDLEGKKRARITWADLIATEEQKLKDNAKAEEMQVPQTEEEAMKMKGAIGDEKDDYVKEIGTVDPLGDFNKMIKNRERDLVKDGLR